MGVRAKPKSRRSLSLLFPPDDNVSSPSSSSLLPLREVRDGGDCSLAHPLKERRRGEGEEYAVRKEEEGPSSLLIKGERQAGGVEVT